MNTQPLPSERPAESRAMLSRDFTLLQVTPALDSGGVETLTVDMATAAAAAGAWSLVASRGGRLEGALRWGGGELIRLPLKSHNLLTIADNAHRLEGVIRREKVSVVHVRSRAPAFSALWAARRTRTPIVATYHGIYSANSSLKRWYNGVMTRGDVVIANSVYTRDHILSEHRIAAGRIELIPEGVDTSIFDPAEIPPERVSAVRESWGVSQDDTRAIVLVAARLTGWKGHRVAIDALARSAWRERTLLVFSGSGENSSYASELSARAAKAGVTLILAGRCADMPAAFIAADVVAAPSTEPESYGRSVAEASAMARIVIASALGGTAETVVDGQTGLLAPAGDVGAWAAALDRALSLSPDERAAMGIAAWTRIREHYSVARMCQATFALYLRLSEART